ncbi:siderophore-iron reductase FhuF [Variovorax boronicumulans]|uniref:siderophore-iron reductase FhuF n=1 Tax=Variovorax boronicumulans TaxID=436515 RepID=UPI002784583D|nr:siderophore-iron reductase FhuF [Variovorax boronicumulans]MDQ0045099.1 ferric iron reductase protein FhuF [Variovorax boronicumulans]
MISLLVPIFQGELAPLGEGLQCSEHIPADALQVCDLAAPGSPSLAEALRKYARFRGSAGLDMRPIASTWSLEYLGMLLPPVVAAASLLQHVFPVAAAQTWVRLDDHGAPVGFHVQTLGESLQGAGTAERYAPLLTQHLAPLLGALSESTRVAPKILWGNVARHLEYLLDKGVELAGGARHIVQDRDWLLHSATWPAPPRVNPLYGRQLEVVQLHNNRPVPLKLHRQCCLCHLLPGEGYCGACPLAPQHRQRANQ